MNCACVCVCEGEWLFNVCILWVQGMQDLYILFQRKLCVYSTSTEGGLVHVP